MFSERRSASAAVADPVKVRSKFSRVTSGFSAEPGERWQA
jgi:hypothetical protein